MIILIIAAWLLLGMVGHYLGWKFADNKNYNVTVGQLIAAGMFGPICLLAVCGILLATFLQKYFAKIHKLFDKVVFVKETK